MRELSSAELEYISGGTDPDGEDIIVTGTPYQPPYYYPPPYYPPPSYYPPGYGGGGYYPPTPPTDDYCPDQEAMQGADEIEAKTDDQNVEYASLVYKSADGTKTLHSPPLGGTGDGIALSTFTNWMTANGVSWSQIQGMVHNHPVNVYGTTQTEADVNRYPSTNDWNFANYAMSQGAQAGFSLYINDTVGTLREFTHADKANYTGLTQQQMDDGVGLPATTRACNS